MKSFLTSLSVTVGTKLISKSNTGGAIGGTLATFLLNRRTKDDFEGFLGTGLGSIINISIDSLQAPFKPKIEDEKVISIVEADEIDETPSDLTPAPIFEENTRLIGGETDPTIAIPANEGAPVIQDVLEAPKVVEFKITRSNSIQFIDQFGEFGNKPFVDITFDTYSEIAGRNNQKINVFVSPNSDPEVLLNMEEFAFKNNIEFSAFLENV